MSRYSKEDIVKLAFKIYKEGETLEISIWRLAELCAIINKNVENGYDIKPLETDSPVLLIREDVNGELLMPPEEEIREVVDNIHHENPSRSELNWYIAEKTLLLDWIKNIIAQNRSNS